MTKLKREYLRKQKLAGLLLVIGAVLLAMLFGEGTIGLLFVPVGMALIFTKTVILDRTEYLEELKERNRQWRLK